VYRRPNWFCQFDAEQGHDLCIFHLPVDQKKPEEFWRHLASYIKALFDNAGNKETAEWAKANPDHWVFGEADEELVQKYAALVRPDQPWDFAGFVFPAMDRKHNFDFVVFPAANFGAVQFSGAADFTSARFSGAADFRWARFSGAADFRWARFSGAAYFTWARFSGDADFSWARFSGAADFSLAQFSGAADFRGAEFSDAAYFLGAQFSGAAGFSWARFSGEVGFSWAQFSDEADFQFARFSGAAYFRYTRFNGAAYITRARVERLMDFYYASLRNRLLFEGTEFAQEARVLLWSIDFVHGTSDVTLEEGHRKGQVIEPAGQVVFRDISAGMNRVSFLHTDILTDRLLVRFSNVKWETNPREFIFDAKFAFARHPEWNEETLADMTGLPPEVIKKLPELFFADKPEPDKETPEQRAQREAQEMADCELLVKQDVERIAREIRLATEKYGSYSDAGDYHVAEMEYRRVQARGFFRFALWLYKVISNYGESPSLALRRLGELWLASANLYFWFGHDHCSPVLWRFWADAGWGKVLERAGWALLASIVNMVPGYFRFQRETMTCWHVVLLMAIQALFGVGILALFLLAIRRRFRR